MFCFFFSTDVYCSAIAVRACVVIFAGERGVRHSVELTAETLYDAAAQALPIFKRSEWADVIGPNTELRVAVKNPETIHTVTPSQIRHWCDGVAVSPDEVL